MRTIWVAIPLLIVIIICCSDNGDSGNPIEPPDNNTIPGWTNKANIPTARIGMGVCVLGSKIYTFGGNDGNAISNKVEVYDILTNNWSSKTPMQNTRGFFATCISNNNIYLIGGTQNETFTPVLSLTEEFIPSTSGWNSKADLPTPRGAAAYASVFGKIYVISGRTGYKDQYSQYPQTNVVEVYDPTNNSWTEKASIPQSRTHSCSIVFDNKIYVIGGEGRIVQLYDPASDSWTTKAELPSGTFHNASAAVANGKIYVFGGFDLGNLEGTSTLFEYTPSSNSWKQLRDLPIKLSISNAVSYNNKIYILGISSGPFPFEPISNVFEFDPAKYISN